jgi:threonine dehydratase
MARSVARREALTHPSSDTFADGMAVRVAVPRAVSELVELGVPMVEVSEREIAEGVGRFAMAGLRVEGSPGAALAAEGRLEPAGGATVVIVCGRNITDELHRRAVEAPETFAS